MDKIEKENFKQGVFQIVKHIPYGRASSYGAVAKAAGYPNMSRMVGRIMCNCSEKDIPAHRVVNSQGIVIGTNGYVGIDNRQKLLEDEGVIIVNNRIKNWKSIFWNPLNEIEL